MELVRRVVDNEAIKMRIVAAYVMRMRWTFVYGWVVVMIAVVSIR